MNSLTYIKEAVLDFLEMLFKTYDKGTIQRRDLDNKVRTYKARRLRSGYVEMYNGKAWVTMFYPQNELFKKGLG